MRFLTVLLVALVLPTLASAQAASPWLITGTGGKWLKPVSNAYGLMVPGLATSSTGCLSVASSCWISPSGSSCGGGGGSGTVTSVGLTAPTGFSVSNSPITDSGDIAL